MQLIYCNLGQNIHRLFQFLAQFLFATSETELDYYQQKVNERVALQVFEGLRLKIPPHGIFAAGGALVPTQEKKKRLKILVSRTCENINVREHSRTSTAFAEE